MYASHWAPPSCTKAQDFWESLLKSKGRVWRTEQFITMLWHLMNLILPWQMNSTTIAYTCKFTNLQFFIWLNRNLQFPTSFLHREKIFEQINRKDWVFHPLILVVENKLWEFFSDTLWVGLLNNKSTSVYPNMNTQHICNSTALLHFEYETSSKFMCLVFGLYWGYKIGMWLQAGGL